MFEPGKSGNPGGRTKKDIEVEAHAKLYAKRAIDVANEIMEDAEAFKGDRLRAAQFIVERAYGKAKEHVTVNHERPLSEASESELEAVLTRGGSGPAMAEDQAGSPKPDLIH